MMASKLSRPYMPEVGHREGAAGDLLARERAVAARMRKIGAAAARSAATDKWSALRTIGVISPLEVATAIAMSACAILQDLVARPAAR